VAFGPGFDPWDEAIVVFTKMYSTPKAKRWHHVQLEFFPGGPPQRCSWFISKPAACSMQRRLRREITMNGVIISLLTCFDLKL